MKKILSVMLSIVMVLSIISIGMVNSFATVVYDGKKVVSIEAKAQKDLIKDVDLIYDDDLNCVVYSIDSCDPIFTVNFDDGSSITGDLWDELSDMWEDFDDLPEYIADDIDTWDVGEHTVTVKFLDCTTEMTVNVVENPIKSIEVTATIPLYENMSGYEYDGDFYYELEYTNPVAKVELKDGSVFEGTLDDLEYEFGSFYYTDSNQEIKTWGLGVHHFTVEFMGFNVDCEVNVVKNKFKSVSAVAQNTLKYRVDGEYIKLPIEDPDLAENNEVFIYDLNKCDFYYTITCMDGSIIEGNADEIFEQTGIMPDYDYMDFLLNMIFNGEELGEHTITINFLALEGSAKITIEDSTSGDLNGDGKVSVVDAKWVLQSVAGTRELTAEQEAFADVNGDGKVSVVDAKWILQSVAGTRVLGGVGTVG